MGMDISGPGGTAAGASAGPPDSSDDRLISLPGRSPVLDAAELGVLRRYGSERDVAAGEVLFADGDETYDLIVMLAAPPTSSRATASPARRSSPGTVRRSSWRDRHAHRAARLPDRSGHFSRARPGGSRRAAARRHGQRARPQRPDLAHVPAPALDPDAPRRGPDADRITVRSRYPAAAGGTGAQPAGVDVAGPGSLARGGGRSCAAWISPSPTCRSSSCPAGRC